MQWYFGGTGGSFQSAVGNRSAWELRWVGGGSISNWADPNYVGWTDDSNQVDGCASNSSSPDRALLNISDDFNTDVNFWIQQTTAAMNNLRHKYPSVRQIILQPVVGGPGGSQCQVSGSVVRASFNFPYINQAISRMVGGSVVAGTAPTVRTCADYADNIGHLTDDAKGPIGVTIGTFYASSSSSPPATSTPTPTATPTAVAVASSTPTIAPTPVPTAVSSGAQTVNFDNLSNPGRPLTGQYPTNVIDWGTGGWYLSGPYGAFSSNSISFNGGSLSSATFSFFTPKRVLQVDAFNGGSVSSTVSLSCNGTLATQVSLRPGQTQSVPMGWIGVCNNVTFGSSNGWNTNFDNLVLDDGAATATPTPTRTPVPQMTATATPTSTATPSSASNFTVNFDDQSAPNRPLNGSYPSGVIDWGTNNWFLSGPFGSFSTNSVSFNGSGPASESINMLRALRLVTVDAYNGGSTTTTVTLTCPGQATVQAGLNPRQVLTIATGWTGTCTSIGVGSTNGWNTNFDNLVFDNGPTSSSPGAITFDDLSNPNRALNGQYPTGVADWGSNVWYLSGPFGAFRTNSISFSGGTARSASFTLLSSQRLAQIDAYNGGSVASTVTLSCAGQPTVSISVAARQQLTIATGWTSPCSTISISSSNGWDTNFDNLVLK